MSRKKGEIGESIAAEYLHKHKYVLLERNFNCKYGEIDIIAIKSNALYFFEVKYRKNSSYGFPEESISKNKITKLCKTIEVWLSRHPEYRDQKSNYYLTALSIAGSEIMEFIIK